MKTAHDIILKPVITENSMAGIADKKYTFKVATDATKIDIANAVEELVGLRMISCAVFLSTAWSKPNPPRVPLWGYDPDNNS